MANYLSVNTMKNHFMKQSIKSEYDGLCDKYFAATSSRDLDSAINNYIELYGDINAIVEHQTSLLNQAIRRDDYSRTFKLVAKGAQFHLPDANDLIPIFSAIHYNRNDIVKLLLDSVEKLIPLERVKMLNVVNNEGEAILHMAAIMNNSSMVEDLTKNLCVNINKKDHLGRTALHIAASSESNLVANALLNNDCIDIFATDQNGKTPLHIAAYNGNVELVNILLKITKKFGESSFIDYLNKPDAEGNSALHYATFDEEENSANLYSLLCANGADVHQLNKQGQSSLHIACQNGNLDFVVMLVETGYMRELNINGTDLLGKTPLDLAISSGSYDIVGMLVKAGANRSSYKKVFQIANDDQPEAGGRFVNALNEQRRVDGAISCCRIA